MSEDKILDLGPDPGPINWDRLKAIFLQLRDQGFPEQTAAQYAVAIGDKPERDADGNVIVRLAGKEVARVKLKEK